MADLEKVIKRLERFTKDMECKDSIWCAIFDEDIDNLKDALELLRTRLPRVMTPEELEQAEIGTVVWFEQRSAERCYLMPMIKDDVGLYASRHLSADQTAARLPRVRFWTSRPTDVQREATPWE